MKTFSTVTALAAAVLQAGQEVRVDNELFDVVETSTDTLAITLANGNKAVPKAYTSLTKLKTAKPSYTGQVFNLVAGGRSGPFETLPPGDYSAEIAADPREGVYVLLDDGQTLKRVTKGLTPNPFWFGAVGDCVWSRGDSGEVTGTVDTAAIKAFILYITREETGQFVNPSPRSGLDAHIPGGYSFRITERLEFYFDNVNFTGDGWLILDHDDTVGVKISEANARLCVNVNIDALNIVSYQSSGTVIDVEDAISLHHSPRIETHGGATHSVDGLTFHAGQWLYMDSAKMEVSGSPIVITPDNGRIFDHVYWDDNGLAGDLVGKDSDSEGVIMWYYFDDTPQIARDVKITGNHLRGGAQPSHYAIKFRRYDTKGGTRQFGNYNPCYNLDLGTSNWTENVGGIVDYDHARNSVDILNWIHEPNLNGGEMFVGESSNAVWNVGAVTLRGGVPDVAYNMKGKVNFNKAHQYISNPTVVFGPNVSGANCSFVQSAVSTGIVKYRDDVSVGSGDTFIDIVHGLALGAPQNVSIIPSWDTTIRYFQVNNSTFRVLFGTAPAAPETLRVSLSTGNVF